MSTDSPSLSHTVTLCFATTKLMTGIIYWPWFLSVLAGCILDVVATVYHALDITHTTVRTMQQVPALKSTLILLHSVALCSP